MRIKALILALIVVSSSQALAAGGTDIVATKGQPAYVQETWPRVLPSLSMTQSHHRLERLVQRMAQRCESVCPGSQSVEDVNRLIAKLAAVKSDLKEIRLCAMKEPVGFGWLTSVPKGNQIPVMFSIGDQTRLDEWYAHVRKPFGQIEFEACPVAVPPTLTLFVRIRSSSWSG